MMTKTVKKGIFLISMRIHAKQKKGQLLFGFFLLVLCACTPRTNERPVPPPVTSPLTRGYIGYGVITASFTHITAEPSEGSVSLGYLRRGTLVRVIRRQSIRGNGFTSWVYIEDQQGAHRVSGWLREDVMTIFNNENQARTAAEFMIR